MFDLEKALAAWRRSLEYNRAFTADDLDELEQHLRDQVQVLSAEGMAEEDAFERAMGEMGDYGTAETEYQKVYWGKLRRQHRLGDEISWRGSMLKNYLLIALRNLRKHKGYTFINITGLALGLAVCLLIGLFVRDERAYDRFHEEADRIYRVVQEEVGGEGLAWSGPQLGLKLKQDFPQIEAVMRLIDGSSGYGSSALISYQDEAGTQVQRFDEEGFLYADPGFFSFFSFPLVKGAPEAVLSKPGTVVVTESAARRYFGEAEPVGKTLLLNNLYALEVTGVAADPPEHSHLTFRFVTSYQTFYAHQGIAGEVNSFWWPPSHTYVKLRQEAAAGALDAALPAFSRRYRDPDDAERLTPRLQPLTDIWLGPDYGGQQQAGGSLVYLYLFSAIALCILVLACVNFMNLTTARAAQRAKEVGVRKVVGAARGQLVVQFLAESVLVSLFALALAFLLARLLLPFFNSVAGKSLSMPHPSGGFWMVLLGLAAATGLAAGFYPAVYLSRFQPAVVTKSAGGRRARGAGLRKILVVFQFTVSMVLLTGTGVVYQQLRYVHQARLGFDKEHVVVLPGTGLAGAQGGAPGAEAPPRYEALKAELLRQAPVRQVTLASSRPGLGSDGLYVWEAEGLAPEPNRQIPVQFVGEGFFEMLDLNMVAGRPLRADDPADIGTARPRTEQGLQTLILDDRALVINEAAARRLGFAPQEALGKQMRFYITENDRIYQDYRGRVVGVVQDYHTASLHEPIGPVAYMPARSPQGAYLWLGYVLVKLAPGPAQQALHTLEQVWQQVVPERPLEATFLDESLDDLYRAEVRLGKLTGAFTMLAVLIACLGLFGLAAFTAGSRTKEIGVRKVLGATVPSIVGLLSKDFLKLVGIAFVVAVPVAYSIMGWWLDSFAYRIEMGPGLFLLVGIVAFLIALVTVSYQALRAALADPVKSLRYE